MIPEQKDMWDRKHAEGQHDFFAGEPSELATKAVSYMHDEGSVLELGCGNGRDARFYASKGYTVIATDLSDVAIRKCVEAKTLPTLEFRVLDIRNKLPFESESFDGVSSMLALHYYSDEVTKEVFDEIYRVLKSGGVFAFSCKSRDEKRTNDATEIEPNIFVDKGGHVLHLFSKEYVLELLGDRFEVIQLDEKEAFYTNRYSTEVQCIARKI
jgi:SAM-dependent methyltransferase